MKLAVIAGILFLPLISCMSFADPLPKGTAPLQGSELRKIYAGNSVIWQNRDAAYFASNGTVKTVFTSYKDGSNPYSWSGYATGHWSVKGNRVCWNVNGVGMNSTTKAVEPFKGHATCWEWYKAGSKYYTRWSRNASFNTSALSRFRSGDRVSGWYEEYRAKLKH